MFYTTLGSLFIITFGADIALKEVFFKEEDPVGHPVKVNTSLPKVSLIFKFKMYTLAHFIFRQTGS